MTRRNSFAITELALALVCSGCAGGLDLSEDDGAVVRANFAHDLQTSRRGGAEPKLIESWPEGTISYAIDEVPAHLGREAFRSEVAAAFDEWARVTDELVVFIEEDDPTKAQIVIGFRAGDHVGEVDCADEFTDPERTIAHVFTYDQGCLAGVIHLNEDLDWVMNINNQKGKYHVRYAILHEVGHLLGLSHSPDPAHIMSPEYSGVVLKLTDEEGVDAIDALEGD